MNHGSGADNVMQQERRLASLDATLALRRGKPIGDFR